eukprot:gene2671-3090_t
MEESWNLLESRILEAVKRNIPRSKTNLKQNRKPIWMNSKVFTKLKKKTSAFKRYMKSKEGEDYQAYAKLRNQAKWACRTAVRDLEKNIANESKINPKAFYNYARSKFKTKSSIPDLDIQGGGKTSGEKQKANVLNEFFSSVFTREDTSSIPDFPQHEIAEEMKSLKVTGEMVLKKLKKLNPNKSGGMDGISPRVLQECAESILTPVTALMNKTLEEGVLPQRWKDAEVTPIYKKGKKSIPGNYRPVSLTNVLCKTTASIIRDHIMDYLYNNKLLTDCQHGFKLQGYGLTKQILDWIRSFLNGRRQRVKVNGEVSRWADVLSGVPQGSVLGPVLFVCYINDLLDEIHTHVKLFADDTKVYADVSKSIKSQELQGDIARLDEWERKWQLAFNSSKCKVMHMGNKKTQQSYYMEVDNKSVELKKTELKKDIGVHVDNKLKFDRHVEIQFNKANKILGLIRRAFTFIDLDRMKKLYTSLIHPILEYGHAITYPRYRKSEKLLENIQHRATKMIPDLKNLEYEDRLKAMDLQSLYYRRDRGDMIECYKMTHGQYHIKQILKLDEDKTRRGHEFKLKVSACNKELRHHFFILRVVTKWNSLPEEVVTAPSLYSFKNRLDKYWKHVKFN